MVSLQNFQFSVCDIRLIVFAWSNNFVASRSLILGLALRCLYVAVSFSGNALTLINIGSLRRARLALGWVTVRGNNILVLSKESPMPTQSGHGHPSVGRRNEYWRWSRSPLGKKQ